MKSDIHPRYITCAVTCGCGSTFTTRATVPSINVEICGACHPFYTGKQKFVDTAGRVEKFQRKFGWKGGAAGGGADPDAETPQESESTTSAS